MTRCDGARCFSFLCFCLIVLGPGLKSAQAQQELPRVAPEAVGVSSARLKRIGETIQRHIEAKSISGAVTLVARRGFVVQYEAYGLKDIEGMKPMTRDTIFKMASSSKPVTGAAIMILVEEGKVRLSDPVSRFIPEFKDLKVAVEKEGTKDVELVKANRQITIRDLMTHTSGLLCGGPGTQRVARDFMWPKDGDTLAAHVAHLTQAPLDFQPGSNWRYSGLAGIDTLGRVVEVASGQSFEAFLDKRVFEPLGMKDTFFHVPADRKDREATIYQTSAKGLVLNPLKLRFPDSYPSGAGGLSSTAVDYFRFGQMLLTGRQLDGRTLLGPRSLQIYASNHVGDMFRQQLGRGEGMGFGLTVEVVEDAIAAGTYRSNGSFGWDGAFGTHFWVDPAEQLVAVLMIQSSAGGVIHRDFETAVMQSIID